MKQRCRDEKLERMYTQNKTILSRSVAKAKREVIRIDKLNKGEVDEIVRLKYMGNPHGSVKSTSSHIKSLKRAGTVIQA